MSVYHQMGEKSINLLAEEHLNNYKGCILSPTNDTEAKLKQVVNEFENKNFEFIFDPQLYYPETEKGQLTTWSYFPSDFYTADLSSVDWWEKLNSNIIDTVKDINITSICSPAIVPNTFPDSYYDFNINIWGDLKNKISDRLNTYLTLIVRLKDLTELNKAEKIASIVTKSEVESIYLIFYSDVEPRREIYNVDEIKGAMKLISLLESNGIKLIVGFSTSDIILWKAAGATSCATGKYFNLRRFTPSRWDSKSKGGGQLAYWFEEQLLTYVREADLVRLLKSGVISEASKNNPYCKRIINNFNQKEPKPWLGLGWRQYLYWFADFEMRFDQKEITSQELLTVAEENWKLLPSKNIRFEEDSNDGGWIKPWKKALTEIE